MTSVNSNFFIPHEHYKNQWKSDEAQHFSINPKDQFRGKVFLAAGLISEVAALILHSLPVASSLGGLPVILPLGLASFGVICLGAAIYFIHKKIHIEEQPKGGILYLSCLNTYLFKSRLTIAMEVKLELETSKTLSRDQLDSINLSELAIGICVLPEFRADPIGYINKWKACYSAATVKTPREIACLALFDNRKFKLYLSATLLSNPSFIPHRHYTLPAADKKNVALSAIPKIIKCLEDVEQSRLWTLDDELKEVATIKLVNSISDVHTICYSQSFVHNPLAYIENWKKAKNSTQPKPGENDLLALFTNPDFTEYLTGKVNKNNK